MAERRCLRCGMSTTAARFELDQAPPRRKCPKCDDELYRQHDGRFLTRDIAHGRETVARAMQKLDELLLDGWRGYSRGVRIIVGGGLIRSEVLGQLRYYRERGIVRSYGEDSPNRGAIVVTLRD
jgi:hypothetical protein